MAKGRGRYGDGTLYQRGRTWWLKYRAGGRWHYESSGSPDKAVAQGLLDTRRGQRASGAPVQPRLDRVTYAEAATTLRTHYEVTGSRDLAEVAPRLARLDAFSLGDRLVAVTTARGEGYAAKRQGQGASNGTINRELAVLGRMLRLAHENGQLTRVPKIRKLTEAAPRAGFVEPAQFEAIRRRLPEDLQAAVTIAFTYGWRRDEILTLERRQLDLEAGMLCLDVGTTKNDEEIAMRTRPVLGLLVLLAVALSCPRPALAGPIDIGGTVGSFSRAEFSTATVTLAGDRGFTSRWLLE